MTEMLTKEQASTNVKPLGRAPQSCPFFPPAGRQGACIGKLEMDGELTLPPRGWLTASQHLPEKLPHEQVLSADLIEQMGHHLKIPLVDCSRLSVARASEPLLAEPGEAAWWLELEARLTVERQNLTSGDDRRHCRKAPIDVCCPSPSQARWIFKARRRFSGQLRLNLVLITPETRARLSNLMAIAHMTPPKDHRLLSDGEVREAAHLLGLDYMNVDELPLPVDALLRRQPVDPDQWGHLSRLEGEGGSFAMLAPSTGTLISTARQLLFNPGLRRSLKLTSMAALREAARAPYRSRCVAFASEGLLRGRPDATAKTVTIADRPALIVSAILAPVLASVAFPALLQLVTSLTIACLSFLRAGGWWQHYLMGVSGRAHRAPDLPPDDLPRYTILVPLYDEDAVVARLTAALKAVDYPVDRLQILMIVEMGDERTQAALQQQSLPLHFEILRVPCCGPQNKPKALNYAVQYASGELITIYDAEDRPEPDQLLKAAAHFAQEGRDLACLQARLVIDHATENWLTAHFALEYETLFGGILPFLSRLGWAFPLGGTSNHFRKGVLLSLGAWDAFNVTEDADLSFRLAKQRWRMKALNSKTFEEAPVSLPVWMAQRRRWFKGWVQTLFVHVSRPRELMTAPRLGDVFALLTMVGGGLVVLAIHPLFTMLVFYKLVSGAEWFDVHQFWSVGLFVAECLVLLTGYSVAMGSAALCATRLVGRRSWLLLTTLPIYWILLSIAFYWAIWDLVTDPRKWHKTPHGCTRQRP